MIFCVLMFIILCLSLWMQELMPVLDVSGFEIHIFLPWAVFYVLALCVPYPVMVAFAIVLGFMWDAFYWLPLEDPATRFGTSIIFFWLLGSLVQGIRPLFRRGNWALPVVMVGLAVLLQMFTQYLLICFTKGSFFFSSQIWFKMVLSSGVAMLMAPILLVAISRIAKKTGYQLEFEQFMFRKVYGHQI